MPAEPPLVPRRRRRFAARPARAATAAASGPVEVVIVGAGAAGIAAARQDRRRRPAVHRDRSNRPCRRTLHHRHQNLRRAVRSRRPLDSPARLQPGDQAGAAPRHRSLSGAAKPESAHRPALRARGRARGFPHRPGAHQARDQRRCAQGRHPVRAGGAERSRRLARNDRIRARSVQLRQEFDAGVVVRFCQSRRPQCRRVLQARFWRAARRARPGALGSTVDAGDRASIPRRVVAVETAKGTIAARRRHRHGVDQCHRVRRPQIQPGSRPSADRRIRANVARQLRSHRARTHRQPARPRKRRSGFREIGQYPHRRDSGQCLRHAALH